MGPGENPVEMAASRDGVVKTLKSIPDYVARFRKAFPAAADPVTFDTMAQAIGAFERKLVTPGRFDAFLAGDDAALTADEKAGLTTFVQSGCVACHNGPAVGGGMYMKLGLVVPWPDASDPGRFNVTKHEEDRMLFRVAPLRNVAKTGPYFHTGKVASLEEAVGLMAKHQTGRTLTPAQVHGIATFLGALTGPPPAFALEKPELPKSTAATPKPDPS